MYRKTARLALSIGLLAAGAQWSLAQETQYPVTIQNGPYSFTVDQPPQRVHEGTRNADTVRRFAEGFYPELFEQ